MSQFHRPYYFRVICIDWLQFWLIINLSWKNWFFQLSRQTSRSPKICTVNSVVWLTYIKTILMSLYTKLGRPKRSPNHTFTCHRTLTKGSWAQSVCLTFSWNNAPLGILTKYFIRGRIQRVFTPLKDKLDL